MPTSAGSRLNAVSAAAPDDVWAVGGADLVLHWNGRSWTRVPHPQGASALKGVAARPADIWAVGSYEGPTGDTAFKLHWNGRSWKAYRSTGLSEGEQSYLYASAVLSARDAWAVGAGGPGFGDTRPVLEHWNGSRWQLQSVRSWGLTDVTAVAPNDAWVVGYADGTTAGEFLAHWDGRRWASVGPRRSSGES